MKKTFKIGEYAIGGIIALDIKLNEVTISAKDWNTKAVIMSKTCSLNDMFAIEMYLNELTSGFYADKITSFIKKSVDNR